MNNFICAFNSVLFVLLMTSVNAQSFEWAKSFGRISYEDARSVALDAHGNVYTVGCFRGTVDFDPSANTYNLTSNGSFDIFIQKLDALGNLVWAKSFGGTSYEYPSSVTIDAQGNIYTVGYFAGAGDFDPSANTHNLTSKGLYDVFMQKLDTSGNFKWVKSFGGPGLDKANSIAVDGQGNIYTVGVFDQIADFDPGAGIYNRIPNGSNDIFIQKLDASGNFEWVKSMGGTSFDYAYSVAIDVQGNAFIVGSFRRTVDFDPGTGVHNLTSNGGSSDIFILKLDVSGNFEWVKSMGGTSSDIANSVAIGEQGNIYIAGNFYETVDFDPGVGTHNLTSNGFFDVFVQKLDALGNLVWVRSMGGIGNDVAHSVALDGQGNVYTIGCFTETGDFDPGIGTSNLTSNGADDIFIQKLDELGNLVWVESIGGINSDKASSVAVDEESNVYTVGSFEGIVNFDFGTSTYNLTSNGNYDVFVHKLNQCSYSTDTVFQTACNSYTWIDGNTYTMNNNTATHILTNVGGCDSVVTLNLTIDTIPDINIVQNGLTLEASTGMDSYQWYLDNTAISGATNVTYTAMFNGAYYCVMVKGTCSENSDIINISQVNIDETDFEEFKVYPNPSKDVLNIQVGEKLDIIQLIGLRGEVVKNFDVKSRRLDISTISKGLYFIKISNHYKQSIQKVIIY